MRRKRENQKRRKMPVIRRVQKESAVGILLYNMRFLFIHIFFGTNTRLLTADISASSAATSSTCSSVGGTPQRDLEFLHNKTLEAIG